MSSLLRWFAGAGHITEEERTALTAQGPMEMRDGLRGWVRATDYRGPDLRTGQGSRSASMLKQHVRGAVAVTPTRILVRAGNLTHLDIPPDHPARAAVQITQDGSDWLVVRYDAGELHPQMSGRVEVRLRTPDAAKIAGLANRTPAG